jgi:hypothetical protein
LKAVGTSWGESGTETLVDGKGKINKNPGGGKQIDDECVEKI